VRDHCRGQDLEYLQRLRARQCPRHVKPPATDTSYTCVPDPSLSRGVSDHANAQAHQLRHADLVKVISVNILYFDLGHGEDYIYRGTTGFHGLHKHDELDLSRAQRQLFPGREKGREERTLEIARAMKANGVAPSVIAQSTGLDHEVIAGL